VELNGGEAEAHFELSRGKPSDVQVRVGGVIFKAHRAVLAAGSKFLATLFESGFKDSNAPTIDLYELKPQVFELAHAYMYHGKCSVPDSVELGEVLSAASALQIDALFETVVAEIERNVTAYNCVSLMLCADRYHLPKLKTKVEVVGCEAFLDVAWDPAVPESSMKALLQSDYLNVTTEQEVFETVLKWLKGQVEPLGEEQQLSLFALVRFPLLSKDFMDSTVMAEPAFLTFLSQKLLNTQFQDVVFSGKMPKRRQLKQVCMNI